VVLLLYQIWEDPKSNSLEVTRASRAADELRRKTSPDAKLVHSFLASSFIEAMSIYYQQYDFGEYRPAPETPDEPHSNEELLAQRSEGYDV